MARKKLIKLYKENEIQNEIVLNVTENGDYTVTAENDKVAIKKVNINTNIPQNAILTVRYMNGSFGEDGDTYLSLHQPANANDYILSSVSGEMLDQCDSVLFKNVDNVYIWGNGYTVGEYSYDNFVYLGSNSYTQAVQVAVEGLTDICLEHYYSDFGGDNQQHSGGAD